MATIGTGAFPPSSWHFPGALIGRNSAIAASFIFSAATVAEMSARGSGFGTGRSGPLALGVSTGSVSVPASARAGASAIAAIETRSSAASFGSSVGVGVGVEVARVATISSGRAGLLGAAGGAARASAVSFGRSIGVGVGGTARSSVAAYGRSSLTGFFAAFAGVRSFSSGRSGPQAVGVVQSTGSSGSFGRSAATLEVTIGARYAIVAYGRSGLTGSAPIAARNPGQSRGYAYMPPAGGVLRAATAVSVGVGVGRAASNAKINILSALKLASYGRSAIVGNGPSFFRVRGSGVGRANLKGPAILLAQLRAATVGRLALAGVKAGAVRGSVAGYQRASVAGKGIVSSSLRFGSGSRSSPQGIGKSASVTAPATSARGSIVGIASALFRSVSRSSERASLSALAVTVARLAGASHGHGGAVSFARIVTTSIVVSRGRSAVTGIGAIGARAKSNANDRAEVVGLGVAGSRGRDHGWGSGSPRLVLQLQGAGFGLSWVVPDARRLSTVFVTGFGAGSLLAPGTAPGQVFAWTVEASRGIAGPGPQVAPVVSRGLGRSAGRALPLQVADLPRPSWEDRDGEIVVFLSAVGEITGNYLEADGEIATIYSDRAVLVRATEP